MPTLNYTFDKLYGDGTSSIDLVSGTPYVFDITNNSGSSYFFMESPRVYDGITPKNTSGSYTSASNIATNVISDYIAGFALPSGINTFTFTPSINVTGSTLIFRGTGGIVLSLSSIQQFLIDNFKTRVAADGGTYEAESCQLAQLTILNNIQ
jgi:hypothetical protein